MLVEEAHQSLSLRQTRLRQTARLQPLQTINIIPGYGIQFAIRTKNGSFCDRAELTDRCVDGVHASVVHPRLDQRADARTSSSHLKSIKD